MNLGPGIFRTYLPKNFLAGGVNCGIRRYRPDLGIIVSDKLCTAVGMFTQNTYKAIPVKYCEELLPSTKIKAIITNSGQANAGTGQRGFLDNQIIIRSTAEQLHCSPEQVLIASTGIIGDTIDVDKVINAIPNLMDNLTNIAEKFALSILTTDLVPKTVMQEVQLSTGKVTVTGICKGSGMIHPNMATMLGYILTDANLNISQSKEILSNATQKSFNMISVDGETSTNDSVFLLSNGASKISVNSNEDFQKLKKAIEGVAIVLARNIARDGEGASKLIEVKIKGAPNSKIAKQIARSLTVSPLIKTAIYGNSPNWGRILARIGAENINLEMLDKCKVLIDGYIVFPHCKNNKHLNKLKSLMKNDEVKITVDFQSGNSSATAWGCDMSEKYIKINAEYIT